MELKGRVSLDTQKASGDMAKLGKSTKELEAELKKAGKAAKTSKSDFDLLGKSMKGMAALGGTALTGIAALGAGLMASVKVASDVAEDAAKFNTVFAQSGATVTRQLDEFGDAVGRNRNDLMAYAATLGDTLKPMGFAEQDAAGLSVQLVKLATDLSSFNNISMDEALERLQGTLIGSHENALKFGVIINENTLKAEMAANGWDKLSGAQLEQAKVQARINLLMQGTTDAQGDAARTADGFANRVRALQSDLEEAAVSVGEAWLPFATDVVGGLGNALPELVPPAVDLAKAMADLATELLSADGSAEGTIETLKNGIEWATAFFDALRSGAEAWKGVGDNASMAADIIRQGFADAFAPIDSFFQAIYSKIAEFYNLMGMDLPPTWQEHMSNLAGAATDLVPAINIVKESAGALSNPIVDAKEAMEQAKTEAALLESALLADDVMLRQYAMSTEMAVSSNNALTVSERERTKALMERRANDRSEEYSDPIVTNDPDKWWSEHEKAGKEAAQAAQSAWQESFNNISSATQSVLGEGFNVLDGLGLDLGGEDTGRAIAENARRLAIVASTGYVDTMDSSIQSLMAERPDLMNQIMASGNPGEMAKNILADFQAGIDTYGLIDEEAAKARIERMLFAGDKKKELMDRITAEILADGQYSAEQVQQAVGAEFGAATGQVAGAMPEEQLAHVQAITTEIGQIGATAETSAATMAESFTGTLEPLEQLQLALEEIVKIVERVEVVAGGATAAVTGLGNSVGLEPVGAGASAVPGFATGGSVMVPGSGAPDSRLFTARVSPGERIDFTPPGQSPPGGGPTVVKLYLDSNQIAQVIGGRQANTAEQLARMGGYAQL